MKRFIILFLIIYGCAPKGNEKHSGDAEVLFEKRVHDLGSVEFDSETECSFSFVNVGQTPFIIYDVEASCGCTVVEWKQKPVSSGNRGEINIRYKADSPGLFFRKVIVKSNSKTSPISLKIKGEVEPLEIR